MEFRNIWIANPARLSTQNDQLVIEQAEIFTVPIEDISSILIESKQVTCTAGALSKLAVQGVTVFFCDQQHLPCCQILPIDQFCRQRKLLLAQVNLNKPCQKQLWQKIVVQKIKNQAMCLKLAGRCGSEELEKLSGKVLSGDSDNREAVAAALYFPALFGSNFSRGSDLIENAMLNYGYAILRGAISRNLVVHGLEPCIGLHHRSELNNFNLADDLIEPFRPLVDLFTIKMELLGKEQLTPDLKQKLFNLTDYLIMQAGKRYRVMTAVGRAANSLANCISHESAELELPELIPLELHHYE
ncbi:CRISPR-associated endonuclease Cas1 [bioreactor metagenome]|uniref:CRISPR-associated endonuclease Cas1 n=1 Tax=bioreactor metagenome TaxID=1076179 RepID=A0A645BMS2_9ZZZZ|nr:type II CRISPR-associated endonuclease Cas1 [Oscillibacter sp.]